MIGDIVTFRNIQFRKSEVQTVSDIEHWQWGNLQCDWGYKISVHLKGGNILEFNYYPLKDTGYAYGPSRKDNMKYMIAQKNELLKLIGFVE